MPGDEHSSSQRFVMFACAERGNEMDRSRKANAAVCLRSLLVVARTQCPGFGVTERHREKLIRLRGSNNYPLAKMRRWRF